LTFSFCFFIIRNETKRKHKRREEKRREEKRREEKEKRRTHRSSRGFGRREEGKKGRASSFSVGWFGFCI